MAPPQLSRDAPVPDQWHFVINDSDFSFRLSLSNIQLGKNSTVLRDQQELSLAVNNLKQSDYKLKKNKNNTWMLHLFYQNTFLVYMWVCVCACLCLSVSVCLLPTPPSPPLSPSAILLSLPCLISFATPTFVLSRNIKPLYNQCFSMKVGISY